MVLRGPGDVALALAALRGGVGAEIAAGAPAGGLAGAMHDRVGRGDQLQFDAGFGLAQRLAGARNLAEAMELQATYWRKQLGELSSQAGEMRTLSTKVTAEVAAPIKAQVTRGMKGLHKVT